MSNSKDNEKKYEIEGQKFDQIPDQDCKNCGNRIFRSIFTGRWKHMRELSRCKRAVPKNQPDSKEKK